MIKKSWFNFFLLSTLFYIALNFLFALIYYFSPAEILNSQPNSIWDAFIFSFQTSSTLGYGYLLPKSNSAHMIVMFDTLAGIFYVAIITGLAFSKFARPSGKVMFSNPLILSSFDGVPTLMFRLANSRETHIVDATLKVSVLLPYESKEGFKLRRFYTLDLLSDSSPAFSLTWTAMHQLSPSSPLYNLSLDEVREKDALFFVSFTGIDDVLSQTIHASHRYTSENLIKAKQFTDILSSDSGNTYTLDFANFHEVDFT